jgi:hypothetical protein
MIRRRRTPQTLLRDDTLHGPTRFSSATARSFFRDERMRKAVAMLIDRDLEADFRWNRNSSPRSA